MYLIYLFLSVDFLGQLSHDDVGFNIILLNDAFKKRPLPAMANKRNNLLCCHVLFNHSFKEKLFHSLQSHIVISHERHNVENHR